MMNVQWGTNECWVSCESHVWTERCGFDVSFCSDKGGFAKSIQNYAEKP
jgi:hypothetical protein